MIPIKANFMSISVISMNIFSLNNFMVYANAGFSAFKLLRVGTTC